MPERYIIFASNESSNTTGNNIITKLGNEFTIQLAQPLYLPQFDENKNTNNWNMSLVQCSIPYVWPNIITSVNDTLEVQLNVNGANGIYQIVFDQGIYSISTINSNLKRVIQSLGQTEGAGLDIKLEYDASTNRIFIVTNSANAIVFRANSNLLPTLGFNQTDPDIQSNVISFQHQPNFSQSLQNVKFIYVECDQVHSNLNNLHSNVLAQIDVSQFNIGVSSYITYSGNNHKVRCPVNGNIISSLQFRILDQALRDLDFTFNDPLSAPQVISLTCEISNE
jgi:hypothetical protein